MELFTQYKGNNSGRGLSPAIWGNCPVEQYRYGMDGVFVFDDFMNFPALEDWNASSAVRDVANGYVAFLDTGCVVKQSAANVGGVIEFDGLDTAEDFALLTVADNIGALARITDTAGENFKFWFETRVKFSAITDAQSAFIGLVEAGGVSDTMMAAAGVGPELVDVIGFQVLEGSGDTVDAIYNEAAGSTVAEVVVDAGCHTLVADTWVKLGLYYDGTAMYWFVNGVKVTPDTAGGASDGIGILPAASQFPDGDYMAPCWGFRMGDTGDDNLYVDWWAMGHALTVW